MPEIKNNFLQAKMNKDLDARLIDNGQYRDAKNIVISRSEGDSVGTVQNILGNGFLSNFGVDVPHLEIIGFYANEARDEIYFFATNYSDASPTNLTNFAPTSTTCAIYCYQLSTNSVFTLVEGNFLNFSQTHPIGGVDTIENLLFWTDNRNQPRKINIETALANSTFYTKEDHISVPVYYPYKPISLYKEEVTSINIADGGQDFQCLTLPHQVLVTEGTGQGLIINITSVDPFTGAITGIEIVSPGVGYVDGEIISVEFKNACGFGLEIQVVVQGVSTMRSRCNEFLAPSPVGASNPNPQYDANWPGDCEFLKDRFVRFGYRFKYTDGEYSLISPFTQAAFVPQNDGYFLDRSYNPVDGALIDSPIYNSDQQYAYSSTVNRVMRNKIDEVGLMLHAPEGISTWADTINELKLDEIDIIYSEDGSTLLYVLDTITNEQIANTSTALYEYTYQSRKPIKTLPESEGVRTSDVAPVRAQSLSSAGNRIIYSNFYNKHTSPQTLEYNANIQTKELEEGIEYQNHTLKQNRNYQVGVVLSDRYGRQSDVILSSIDDGVIPGLISSFKGSTVYNNYRQPNEPLDTPVGGTWRGETLSVIWKSYIPETLTQPGYPGIYDETNNPLGWYSYKIVVKQQQQEYYNIYLPSIMNGYPNIPDNEVNKTAHISLFSDNINKVPKDLVDVGPEASKFRSSINVWGRVTNTNLYESGSAQFYPTPKSDFVHTIGTVKDLNIGINKTQQQNNSFTIGAVLTDAFLLDGDVIRGPEGVIEGCRVSAKDTNGTVLFSNARVVDYSQKWDSVNNQMGTLLVIDPPFDNTLGPVIPVNSTFTFDTSPFYNSADNPLIGRISTIQSNLDTLATKNIGEEVDFSTLPTSTDEDFFNIQLAVYEDEPVFSNLDIYWETSTTGLVAELNQEIKDGDVDTPFGYSDPGIAWFEDEGTNAFVSAAIYPVNASGGNIVDQNAIFTLDSVTLPAQGNNIAPSWLVLENNGNGSFVIKTTNTQAIETLYYGQDNLLGMGVLRATVTSIINFATFTSYFDIELSNIVPSWTYNVYPAETFNWTDGPTYPTGASGNLPAYLGSLIGYGFYGASANDPWDGVSCSGKTDGEVTNGTFIPNQSGYQTKELKVTNLNGILVNQSNNAGVPPPVLTEGSVGVGNISAVPALAGAGCGFDTQDLSTTGLGIIIGYIPSKSDPVVPAYVSYKITFTLTDGGGLSENYEVKATLITT